MIEYPIKTTDGTNNYYTFPDTQPRTLVLSNGDITNPAYFRLQRDTAAISVSNFDIVVDAMQTEKLEGVCVLTVSVDAADTVSVFRYV